MAGAATAVAAFVLGRSPVRARSQEAVDLEGVAVIARSSWGADLPPTGPLPLESEVRYLLVHHSVDPGNTYGEGDVAHVLREFYRFHTGGRGWPDLAYNFLVDRFGRVWEGRTGSVFDSVAGDATGGNQGSDQLCCFIGNHQKAQPSPAAMAGMGRLLAALGRRYGIPMEPGATTVFTSRGSNRHPEGTEVATPTITGHREMSLTRCPGDLVVARLPELRSLAAGVPIPPSRPATPRRVAADAVSPATTTQPTPSTTADAPPASTSAASGAPAGAPSTSAAPAGPDEGQDVGVAAAVAGAATAAAAAALGQAWNRRRGQT